MNVINGIQNHHLRGMGIHRFPVGIVASSTGKVPETRVNIVYGTVKSLTIRVLAVHLRELSLFDFMIQFHRRGTNYELIKQ